MCNDELAVWTPLERARVEVAGQANDPLELVIRAELVEVDRLTAIRSARIHREEKTSLRQVDDSGSHPVLEVGVPEVLDNLPRLHVDDEIAAVTDDAILHVADLLEVPDRLADVNREARRRIVRVVIMELRPRLVRQHEASVRVLQVGMLVAVDVPVALDLVLHRLRELSLPSPRIDLLPTAVIQVVALAHPDLIAMVVGELRRTVLQLLFEQVEMLRVDLARRAVLLAADGRRQTHSLAKHPERAHHAHRGKSAVRAADVASREKQVRTVSRVEAAVRNRIVRTVPAVIGDGAERLLEGLRILGIGEVEVDAPGNRRGGVRMLRVVLQVVLRQHIVADDAIALAFAANWRDSLEGVVSVLRLLRGFVLNPMPVREDRQ